MSKFKIENTYSYLTDKAVDSLSDKERQKLYELCDQMAEVIVERICVYQKQKPDVNYHNNYEVPRFSYKINMLGIPLSGTIDIQIEQVDIISFANDEVRGVCDCFTMFNKKASKLISHIDYAIVYDLICKKMKAVFQNDTFHTRCTDLGAYAYEILITKELTE